MHVGPPTWQPAGACATHTVVRQAAARAGPPGCSRPVKPPPYDTARAPLTTSLTPLSHPLSRLPVAPCCCGRPCQHPASPAPLGISCLPTPRPPSGRGCGRPRIWGWCAWCGAGCRQGAPVATAGGGYIWGGARGGVGTQVCVGRVAAIMRKALTTQMLLSSSDAVPRGPCAGSKYTTPPLEAARKRH